MEVHTHSYVIVSTTYTVKKSTGILCFCTAQWWHLVVVDGGGSVSSGGHEAMQL